MTKERVVVAMSGGVDSSVAAALMVESGYEVVGITLQLYDHAEATRRKGACCAGIDIYDARNVAAKLNIPHYVLDYEQRFKAAVMDDFADAYLRGETPVPCINCNQKVKFRDLLETARELGAQGLVTGHYVRRVMGPHGAELHRGTDEKRDQSYFMFATTQAQLDFLRFPLGNITKDETRAYAHRLGLQTASKPDSQDICFVVNGTYSNVIERLRPGSLEEGDIVHIDGHVMGRHTGIINYTIGQRRGLGIGGGEPLFVIKLEPDTKRVIVGPYEALAQKKLHLQNVNWLGSHPLSAEGYACTVKIRSTKPPIAAHLYPHQEEGITVVFATPEYGISPGQACVFYENTRVLGGGWIQKSA